MTDPTSRVASDGGGPSPRAVRVLVVTAAVALAALLGGVAEGVNRDLYDRALRWRSHTRPADPKPWVLVEIDDRSIDRLGRFPWTRSRFAELLDRTRVGGARAVGVDVIFAEAADSAGDAALAAALARAGNVVIAAAPVFDSAAAPSDEGALAAVPVVRGVVAPIDPLAAAAAGVGSVSILEDADGAMRRYSFLLRRPDGTTLPSFAQLVAGLVLGDSAASVRLRPDGSLLINYGSLSPEAVLRVSFADVLEYDDEQARQIFGDRIALVGTTFTAGTDYGPTPLSPRSPGVFAQLFAVETLRSGRFLRQPPGFVPFLLALVVAGILATQIPARHPLQLLGMGAALVAALLVGTLALYLTEGIVVGPALPILATGLVVAGYGLEEWSVANRNLRKRNRELQETLDALRRTRSAKERMEAELNIARDIQFSMLPSDPSAFADRSDFAVHATLVPALEVGGDFYDYFLVDDDHLCVCVADVSGKGVPAALFMAVSKSVLRSIVGREPSPAAVMTAANEELARDNEASMFVTAWLGILDLRTGGLTYSNAGHNPPYLLRREGGREGLEAVHGPVMAALDGIEYGEDSVSLAPGDLLLLYTDGVTEARDPDGGFYGDDRLQALVERVELSVEGVVEEAAGDVWRFQDTARQADDVTLVGVQYFGVRRDDGSGGGRESGESRLAGASLDLEVDNRLDEIPRVVAAFEAFAVERGVPSEVRRSVKLALDDVVSNVVNHAYGDDARHVFRVAVELQGDRLTVRVVDDGVPFDPLGHPVPDLELGIEEREIGGLGIHLVQSLMDEVSHAREDGRNVTVLVKNIPGTSS